MKDDTYAILQCYYPYYIYASGYKVQEYMFWQHRFKLSMTSKVGYGGRRSSEMVDVEQKNFYIRNFNYFRDSPGVKKNCAPNPGHVVNREQKQRR